MDGRHPRRGAVRGWVVGAVVGAAVGVLGSAFVLNHLADAGWNMTGWAVAKGLARAGLLFGAIGAFVGAVSDWGDRLRARQSLIEPGAAPDPAAGDGPMGGAGGRPGR